MARYNYGNNIPVETMLGLTIDCILRGNSTEMDWCTLEEAEKIKFITTDGRRFVMYHQEDCCEYVRIQDVIGDIDDIIGSPLTMCHKETNSGDDKHGSHTWTFYKFATVKGYVTLRWLGESNGYYSEDVDFTEITNNGRV